ncbi:MOSC domain-containing protein [Gemmatimonas sp.]
MSLHSLVVSVNVGILERVRPDSRQRSGIRKQPIGGPALCDTQGLLGDAIGNRTHHGGPDQAVYLYSAEDYAWWSATLQRECQPGLFGENLTIDRWWPSPRIGDRLQCGDVVLELAAPRIPCATLAARMQDTHFVQQFAQARLPGAYARVLQSGVLEAGQRVTVTRGDTSWPTVVSLFDLWFAPSRSRQALIDTLRAPLASRLRDTINRWLAAHSA